jgi:catechol 2,3-dioxygenase-like lactoylglutathione lyase family enzyme
MSAKLSRIVLMVRPGEGLQKATKFYQTLGLTVSRATEEWTEFAGTPLALHVSDGESTLSTGYSPILQFAIKDMDAKVAQCLQLGAHLDGPIQYPAHGKVAALRAPDGHMVGLYEPAEDP